MRILLDTSAMAGTATALRQIGGELEALSLRVTGDAVVLMPPAVAAQVAADVGAAALRMRHVSGRYGHAAGELDRRRVFAENAEYGRPNGGSFWQRLVALAGHPLVDAADGLLGTIEVLGHMSALAKLSKLNRLDGWLIKRAFGSRFGLLGKAFYPLAAITAVDDAIGELTDARNGNWLGRYVAAQGSLATNAALTLYLPAGFVDFALQGTLKADADAIFGMYGRGLSEAWDSGWAQARKDLDAHNYLGLGFNVVGAATRGGLHGANVGLNAWADDVASGQYSGFLKTFSDVENKVIDKAWSAGETVGSAISGARRNVTGWVKKLF
jgi:hypothetical protein